MAQAMLETERLRLRRFEVSDTDRLLEYRNDVQTARMQGWPVPFARSDAERFIASMAKAMPGRVGDWFQFAIADRTTNRILGDVGLFSATDVGGSLGYTLHPDSRGHGFAREAVRAVAHFAFDHLGFASVSADTLSDNLGSLRVLAATGFIRSPTRAGRVADLSGPGHDVYELDYHCTPETLDRPLPILGLLTGGKSTRMGRDKATTSLAGQPMASWVANAGAKAGLETFVLGPDDAGTDRPTLPDRPHPQLVAGPPPGPLRGLDAALAAFPHRPVILAATDQPFVQPTTLLQLALQPDADVVVAIDEGYPQVTLARYAPNLAALLRATPISRLRDVIELGDSRIIEPEVWRRWGEDGRSFRSLDRPEDLDQALIDYSLPDLNN